MWDAETGREVFNLTGIYNCVYSVAFSPDGKRLVTAGGRYGEKKPTEIKLWDMETGQEVLSLKGHNGTVL